MKIARRYRLLQKIVFAQGSFSVLLSLYVLVAHKKSYPLTVTVQESPALDLTFLDGITNAYQFAKVHPSSDLGAPVVSGSDENGVSPFKRFPFCFERYCVVDGEPCAVVGKWIYRVGDKLNGCIIDSVSPLGVVVDGSFYSYSTKKLKDGEI